MKRSTLKQVQQNMGVYGQKVDQLNSRLYNAQDRAVTNYNITVNAPKEVKQVQGSTDKASEVDISTILREAQNLVRL